MKKNPLVEPAKRVEAYLAAVAKHLADKPEDVRQEVVAGLRDHIDEALRRAGGDPSDVIEGVLAGMDPPESFGIEGGEDELGGVARGRGRFGGMAAWWFWLGVAFLLVNAWGVWKWAGPHGPVVVETEAPSAERTLPRSDGEGVAPVRTLVLALRSIEQVDFSVGREVTLRLNFNAQPNEDMLSRYLRFTDGGGRSIDYELLGRAVSNSVMVQTAPVMSDRLNYVLNSGYPALSGQRLGTPRTYRGQVTLQEVIEFRNITASSPSFGSPSLFATFSIMPKRERLTEFVSIEPSVNFTVEHVRTFRETGLRLTGDFEVGTLYTLTLKEGLQAENGSWLAEEVVRQIQFPLRKPALRFEGRGRYLAPRGRLAVPFEGVNISEYVARLRPVFPNNLVQLAQRERRPHLHWDLVQDLTGHAITRTNRLAMQPDKPQRIVLGLRDLLDHEPRGAYWLEVTAEGAGGGRQLVVVTDLGLSVQVFPGGLQVWVNSLRQAEPVPGAHITVLARNNQTLASGVSDEQGLARLDIPPDEEPFLIVAQKDGDLSYMDFRQTLVEQGDGLDGRAYLDEGDVEAAVFTERGIYRPGETVLVQALARDSRNEAPGSFPVLFRVRRPDGRIFRDHPVVLDALGAARAEIELPDYLPTGRYQIELVFPGTYTLLGDTHLALEDFAPPRIRVHAEVPAGRLRAGGTARVNVLGEHLFGRPAEGLTAYTHASIRSEPFAPADWPAWRFGDDEKQVAPIYQMLGTQTLDRAGLAAFSLPTSRAGRPPAAYKVVFQTTVIEAGGRAVTAYASADMDVYPFYIGMRRDREGPSRVGEEQRVQIVQVQPDGSPVDEGKPLVLELARVQWHSALRRNAQGRYEWKSERQTTLVREDTMAADGQPREWSFVLESPGEYTLLARDPASGASTRMALRAVSHGQDWVERSREKPGRVELSWDHESYRPGAIAQLLVAAPFSGTALLSIESDRVREAYVVKLTNNTATLDVPVLDAYAPNVYCRVTVIRPAEADSVWKPHRAQGVIPLTVERPRSRLRVELDAPERVLPQSRLRASVQVFDEEGKAAHGEVSFMAVDEGICMLTAFQTPDPNRIFSAQRRLGVQLYDVYSDLVPLVDDEVTGVSSPAGDEAAGLRRRLSPVRARRFIPLARWQTGVVLDEEGRGTAELEIPEFSGTVRLMVVAYNASEAGATERHVVVRRDLVVEPALPRFLAMGDVGTSDIVLYNEGSDDLKVHVKIDCEGPVVSDPSESRELVPAGASRAVPFSLTAGPGIGKARVHLEVSGGDDTIRETIELPVRPAGGMRVHVTHHTLEAGETLELAPPEHFIPATVSQDGALSAWPSLNWSRALDYVVNYPYGCLEQTVSGAFPLLYAADWADLLLPGSTAGRDPEKMVNDAILRVLSMQQANGGFSAWPRSRRTYVPASLYATHFLVEARAAGHAVPSDRLDAALAWVRERLTQAVHPDPGAPAWLNDMEERAYVCYILALAGQPDAGWTARLREHVDRLYFASQIQTASALLLMGEPRQARPMLEGLGWPSPRPRIPGRILNSDVRDAAMLLSAWLETDPQNERVVRLARYLDGRLEQGHWGTTQDNAMALLAFGKYERYRRRMPEAFSGVVRFHDGTTRTVTHRQDVHWTHETGQAGRVEVLNEGPGPLYLMARFEGVAMGPEEEYDRGGLTIRREYLDLEGKPLDPANLRQGSMVIVRLALDPRGRTLDHFVIEELLPGGWEIENPNLATSHKPAWLDDKSVVPTRHRDIRDDRLLIFTDSFNEPHSYYYTARAVSPGEYIYPPVVVSGMYDPEIRSVSGGTDIVVRP